MKAGHSIPQVQIQPDTLQVLLDYKDGKSKDEKVWLHINATTYNLSVNETSLFDEEQGITVTRSKDSATEFLVRDDKNDWNFKLEFPQKYHVLQTSDDYNLTCIATCNDKVMIGTDNGAIIKLANPLPINISKIIVKKNAHFADITKIMTFPSCTVLLTVGLDMQIKIWSNVHAEDELNEPVRVLGGVHKSRITDCVMIGKGRNVISCSLDGKIVMWEIGSGKHVWTGQRIRNLKDQATCLAIMEHASGDEAVPVSDKFYECKDKILLCGYKSGYVSIWDCNTRLSLGEFQTNVDGIQVNQISCDNDDRIIVGLDDGTLLRYTYNFDKREASLDWETQFDITGAFGKSDVKKLEIIKDMAYVLTDSFLACVRVSDGKICKYLSGYEDSTEDFQLNHNKSNSLILVGKRGFIASYSV